MPYYDDRFNKERSNMTKKDYELIAAALRTARPERFRDGAQPAQWDHCVGNLVQYLAGDSPKFNADEFITACGGFWNGGNRHVA